MGKMQVRCFPIQGGPLFLAPYRRNKGLGRFRVGGPPTGIEGRPAAHRPQIHPPGRADPRTSMFAVTVTTGTSTFPLKTVPGHSLAR
jgi:hypothetical protein